MHLLRLYHTIRHLRWQQLWFRVCYPILKSFYKPAPASKNDLESAGSFPLISFYRIAPSDQFNSTTRTFSLLNIDQSYPQKIDWNDMQHGSLWAYHLNYFNWLEEATIAVADQIVLLQEYAQFQQLKIGLDAYPISLRGTNWIRFFSANNVRDEAFNQLLFQHYHRLFSFPEYSIQGNHLWENGCSLIWAGHYFNAGKFYQKGKSIFQSALQEQISADGAHVEGSPMYHSLLLYRLLQTIEMLKYSDRFTDKNFESLLKEKAALMLGWLIQFTFSDGNWPQFNDSTNGIAPTTNQLLDFANYLSIEKVKRTPCYGYKMIRTEDWEMAIDAANVQPAWQPGHTHADALTFCLNVAGKPIIVDPGVSTYEAGKRRNWERGTDAHNTVLIDNKNSSDVWKIFRLGKRAHVTVLSETKDEIMLMHDGYRSFGWTHERCFQWSANRIVITDTLKNLKHTNVLLNLHVHPDAHLEVLTDNSLKLENLVMSFDGASSVEIQEYIFAESFNKTRKATRLSIKFSNTMKMIFDF